MVTFTLIISHIILWGIGVMTGAYLVLKLEGDTRNKR